ncbi:transaldolase family protein, partial [Sulfurovum sp.]
VKGDNLPADYYIRELFAPHSVNTAPLGTIEAYLAKKATAPKLPLEDAEINGYFTKLKDCGFDMQAVYDSLLKDGLEAFEKAFQDMLKSIE